MFLIYQYLLPLGIVLNLNYSLSSSINKTPRLLTSQPRITLFTFALSKHLMILYNHKLNPTYAPFPQSKQPQVWNWVVLETLRQNINEQVIGE